MISPVPLLLLVAEEHVETAVVAGVTLFDTAEPQKYHDSSLLGGIQAKMFFLD